MRRFALIAVGLLASAATPIAGRQPRCDGAACHGTLVLIGTQTSGPGQGIVAAQLDPGTGALTPLGLAAEADHATWLARDPTRPVVYAVSETGSDAVQGGVYSFALDRPSGKLALLSRAASGGAGPAHLTYDPRLRTVFVANYGSGHVAALPVAADGRLDAPVSVQRNIGSGPDRRRQAGAHAHGVVVDPSGRFVLAADLGADKVFVYRWDSVTRALLPAATPWATFSPGSGPRHLVFSPDGRFAFVTAELTSEVHALRWDARNGRLTPVAHVALDSPDYGGAKSAAEIATSADGRFLYASNRGANLIQVFAIDRASGALAAVQRIDCGGTIPWSFALDPSGRWLVVTNQGSGNLAVFAVDRRTGRLNATGRTMPVNKPVTLAFIP